MNSKSRQFSGFIYVALSALMYATMPLLGKYAYGSGLEPDQVIFLRYGLAFLILATYLPICKKTAPLSKSPLVWLQGSIFIMGSLFYFFALRLLPVSLVTIILFSYPALVSLLSIVVYREKLGLGHFAAVLLAIAGTGLAGGFAPSHMQISTIGVLLAAATAVCYTVFCVLGQKTTDGTSPLSLTASISFAGIIIILLFFHSPGFLLKLNLLQLFIGLALGLVDTVMAVSFYLKGIQLIGAARASLVSILEPVLTVLMAVLFLHEHLGVFQLAGLLLVLTSMFMTLRSGAQEELAAKTE
ncbi:MAG: DMT family transporter [Deltaproteobacteria bacterium]